MGDALNERRTPSVRGMPIVGFAVFGLVAGHALSYLLAIPAPRHRDLVLRATGHAYLPALTELGILLLLAGVTAVVARAWSSGRTTREERYAPVAGLLATLQVGAFTAQEILERLLSRSPLSELLHDHILVTGVLVQIALALAGAAVLRWLVRTTDRLVDAGRPSPTPSRPWIRIAVPVPSGMPHGRTVPDGPSVRAPPSP